jgi:NADH:ubiquinone oxidoreductase subunit 5 (subunit L)/multisubunit Na+/H+ antiporter MnhA subunit
MPQTATAFLLGSVAICGLPPLNGFISEWLVVWSLLEGGRTAGVMQVALVALPGLALIGGLAIACFTKLNGVMFLGQARQPISPGSSDPVRGMTVPLWTLTGACVALGVVPLLGILPAARAGAFIVGGSETGEMVLRTGTSLTIWAILLVVAGLLVWLARRKGSPRASEALGVTWACGLSEPSSRMQYTAASYAAPLLSAFDPLSSVQVTRGPTSLHTHPVDLVLDRLAHPLWDRVRRLSGRARLLQAGRVRWYLLYVILTLVGLLLYLGMNRG